MQYQSDYLGRMQWIIYPDGEKIIYGYDEGGQVTSVTGKHYNQTFPYVTKILYDQYGQRTRIEYGNGTYTDYTYNPERRWLETVKTRNKYGQSYQNIRYDFDRVGNVRSYVNDCMDTLSGNYKTDQSYEYDDLYQLIHVTGNTEYYPAISSVPDYKSTYTQDFAFDDKGLGNMMSKVSKETVSPLKVIGDNLNYNIGYVYDENYAHRLVKAGNRYYKYDANGNIICEQDGSFDGSENDEAYYKVEQHAEDVYSTDNGWGLFKDESGEARGQARKYRRTYTWNSRNQLVSSVDSNYSTSYVYGQDGQRSNKYTQGSETLYFNKMWTLHTDNGNSVYGGQYAKNVYLGETRIVTKLARADQKTAHEETYKQYYYHSDHLGSATMISDWEGKEYQRIEYTPYGETWVEKTNNSGSEFLPYKFTGKEVDQETGLYYYGARYLDPKYSMWISTDPALGEYVPEMGKGNAKDSGSLPGMGGIFNHINGNLYAYAGNNPVRYIDPDGRYTKANENTVRTWLYEAMFFISQNVQDKYDEMLVEKLTEMMNNGKIQLDDVTKRYESPSHSGHSKNMYAFFDPFRNTETHEQRNIIVIDVDKAIKTGFAELIDTLAHEGWHAVQGDLDLIQVDENNHPSFSPNLKRLEQDAYFIGDRMYNRYAVQNNLREKPLISTETENN